MKIQWSQIVEREGQAIGPPCSIHMLPKVFTQVETERDLVPRIQEAAGVIRDMQGIFPRVRHDIIRRYTICIEARRAGSDGSMSASDLVGLGFDPRRGSKFTYENFQSRG